MNKKDFFIKAMQAGECKRRAWVISAFSLIKEDTNDWKKDSYPYRIVQTPTAFFFVDPENNNGLTIIDDYVVGTPLFRVNEKIIATANDGINNLSLSEQQTLETTYGRLLFNYVCLIYPFGNKIPFINKRVKPSDIEDIIVGRLKDNPKKDSDRNDIDIYVSEYLTFCDAVFYLTGFTQICVPAASQKTLTAAPGIEELKNRLLKENKDHLDDPAVIARIDAELVKYDRNWMKGDSAEGFLISDKSFKNVRKKLFGMHGAEAGFGEGNKVELVQNSLSQGWDINNFPAMNNTLRAGSFNRGAETQKGGEAVKWLFRASSNLQVTEADCGSKLGMLFDIDETNLDKIIGFSIVEKTGIVKISTEDEAKKYIGKRVTVRSPMFCKLEKTDFCQACVGDRLAVNPTGLSIAVAEYGSILMLLSMKAMHGKTLELARVNYKDQIF